MWNKASLFALFAMAGQAVHLSGQQRWGDDTDNTPVDTCVPNNNICPIVGIANCIAQDDLGNHYRGYDPVCFEGEDFEHVCIDPRHYEELCDENYPCQNESDNSRVEEHKKCYDNKGYLFAIYTHGEDIECPEACKFESVCQ